MAPAVTPKEFLKALWGNTSGWAELAVIDRKGTLISALPIKYPDYIDTFLTEAQRFNKQHNVYMGVCLKREKWPRPTGQKGIDGKPEIEKRGTEANALSSMVVWVDLDFKGSHHGSKSRTIDKEVARKLLKDFPLKPSIIIKSGGDQDSGIHPYWLLKEPALGAELKIVKAINKAIVKYFHGGFESGADSKSIDLARVLRLPDSINWNVPTPTAAYISWWHPEWAYTLMDFEGCLDIQPIQENLAIELPTSTTSMSEEPTALDTSNAQSRPTPTSILDDETCQAIGKLFSEFLFRGSFHDTSLSIAGWMAFSGIKYECALKIVETASKLSKCENVEQKLKNVKDTYTKFIHGGEVTGKPSFEKLIESEYPGGKIEGVARKKLEDIQKLLPKPKGFRKSAGEVDFKILHLRKFTSQPAVWTATLEKEGQRLVAETVHTRFMRYELFVEDVFDQNGIGPSAGLKNPEWRYMINQAIQNGLYEEKTAPEELRTAGAIDRGLEEFLAEAKETPDVGLLKKFPGYDADSTFFKLGTFRDFIDEQGHKFSQNQLSERLKTKEWESRVRRFGKKLVRVWVKDSLPGTGNGHGDGNSNGPNGNGNGHGHNGHTSNQNGETSDPTSPTLFPGETTD